MIHSLTIQRTTMKWIAYKWRWWKWFLGGPSIARLVLSGVDKDSRRIIYARHDALEPKP